MRHRKPHSSRHRCDKVVIFEVLTAVFLKIKVLWDVT
jgi:hypothetical protein